MKFWSGDIFQEAKPGIFVYKLESEFYLFSVRWQWFTSVETLIHFAKI
jgi:hypothetical protein